MKDETASEILKTANRCGVVYALKEALGGCIGVSIPFDEAACSTSIDDVAFSARAEHSLKRVGVFTVGGVFDLIASGGLLSVRNLGKKTQNEVKTRLLAFGYERLSQAQKERFLSQTLAQNRK